MKRKIALVGLIADTNFGDRVIADCSEFLYRKATERENYSFFWVNIAGADRERASKPLLIQRFNALFARVLRVFSRRMEMEWQVSRHYRYFLKRMPGSCAVVVAGGGLIKFKYQHFHLYLAGLVRAASSLSIPVVLNAMGIEGFDDTDERCRLLIAILNNPIVKVVTTRDDLETLDRRYLKDNSVTLRWKISDPAVWAPETYQLVPGESATVVGIGLIRSTIFEDNSIHYTPDQLVELYASIIFELERRSIAYKCFTNGLAKDAAFGIDVFNRLGRAGDVDEILIPREGRELTKIISSFSGIIASRMHACIIAASFCIPCIGLVWNEKLAFFGETIGYPRRFIRLEYLEAVRIVDELERAMEEGCDQNRVDALKKNAMNGVVKSIAALNLRSIE